ncbi:MAG: tetratricopeptide repeat protein [Deltaproteobacteria bacterium]|nr:tetratricopeptide repeat protein [Deltaproteobacteria bacterium]
MTINSPQETARRVRQLLRDKHLADAIQVCRDGLAGGGANNPELRLLVAHGLLAQGDQDAAKKEAQSVLRVDPRQVEAHRILADVACTRGEFATASYQLEKILALGGEDANAAKLLRAIENASFSGTTELTLEGSSRVASLERFLRLGESGVMPISDSMMEVFPDGEPEEQPTLPLLRPSAPAEPVPHLDPHAAKPVSPKGLADLLGDPRDIGDGSIAPLGTMPVSPSQILAEAEGGDLGEEDERDTLDVFDDFDVEDASAPNVSPSRVNQAVQEGCLENDRTRVARPREKTRKKHAPSPQLPIERVSTGGSWDPTASEEELAPQQRAKDPSGGWDPLATPPPEGLEALPSTEGWDPLADVDEEPKPSSDSISGWDPLATPSPEVAHKGLGKVGTSEGWDPLGSDGEGGGEEDSGAWDPLSDVSSSVSEGEDAFESELAADLGKSPRKGGGRWLKVLVVLLLLAGGGGYGAYWYLGYTFVKEQWVAFRHAAYGGTPSGYKEAEAIAKKILERKPGNTAALAAQGMCAAALAIDFGEDRRKEAQDALTATEGKESEWRTAAQSFLSRLDDPATLAGYLAKSAELYPKSALLHYLRGRALEATGSKDQEAVDAYQKALKLSPSIVSARLALALLVGKQAKGYENALVDLDKVLQKSPDNVQALLTRVRVRVLHHRDLASAQADAARISGELMKSASRSQLAWAHLVQAQIESQRIQAIAQGLRTKDKDKIAVMEAAVKRMGQALDEAIKSAPCCDCRFRYELAGELMGVFRLREAHKELGAALAFKARTSHLMLRAARCALELGKVDEAAKALDIAPPNAPETKLLRGRVLYARGTFKEATSQLKTLAGEARFGAEARLYTALAQARAGKAKEALNTLRSLAKKHPNVDTLQRAIGLVHRWTGDLKSAEVAFKRAWRLNRLDPRHATALGEISLARYDFTRAQRRLNIALATRPDHTRARVALALLALRRGDSAKAIAELQRVIPADQQHADYLLVSARIALVRGDLAACESGVAAAKQAGARAGEIAHLQGDLVLAQRKPKTALPLLKRARKLQGKAVDVLLSLGRAQIAARHTDDAYESFQDALDVDKGNPEALIVLAKIAIRDGELPRAVSQLGKAIAEIKRRASPVRLLARAYAMRAKAQLKRGDTGRALADLQDALEVDGEAVQPHVLMGKTYKRLNRPERALAYYQKALALLAKRPGAANAKVLQAQIQQLQGK